MSTAPDTAPAHVPRKWLVLAAALLLVLAGSLRLLRHKTREPAGPVSVPPQDPVVLSGGGTPYAIPGEFSAVPARTAAPATYGALPTIKDKIYDKGPCKGGSLNEILTSHGRIWGEQARHGAFLNTETEEIYGLAGGYLACVGLARRAPAFCDYLPAGGRGEKGGEKRANSPNYKCRELYSDVEAKAGSAEGCPGEQGALCSAFASGSEASCSALLAKLGVSYCSHLAAAQKRTRGYAGFSPEELRAVFKQDEDRKAAEAQLRLENEKITEEINQRVRKLMDKQAGSASSK